MADGEGVRGWEGGDIRDVFTGREKLGVSRPFILLTFQFPKKPNEKTTLRRGECEGKGKGWRDGWRVFLCGGEGGYSLHIQNPAFSIPLFFRSGECFTVYTYRYIDTAADRRVYIYIYPLHRQLLWKERETDFVCHLSRKRDWWSWLPMVALLRPHRLLRNLQTQTERQQCDHTAQKHTHRA